MRKINTGIAAIAIVAIMSLTACEDDQRIKTALQKVQETSTALCVSEEPDNKAKGNFVDALLDYQVERDKANNSFNDIYDDYSSAADVAEDVGAKCQQVADLTEAMTLKGGDRITSP